MENFKMGISGMSLQMTWSMKYGLWQVLVRELAWQLMAVLWQLWKEMSLVNEFVEGKNKTHPTNLQGHAGGNLFSYSPRNTSISIYLNEPLIMPNVPKLGSTSHVQYRVQINVLKRHVPISEALSVRKLSSMLFNLFIPVDQNLSHVLAIDQPL